MYVLPQNHHVLLTKSVSDHIVCVVHVYDLISWAKRAGFRIDLNVEDLNWFSSFSFHFSSFALMSFCPFFPQTSPPTPLPLPVWFKAGQWNTQNRSDQAAGVAAQCDHIKEGGGGYHQWWKARFVTTTSQKGHAEVHFQVLWCCHWSAILALKHYFIWLQVVQNSGQTIE